MSRLPPFLSRPVVVPIDLGARSGSVQIRGALRIDWAARISSQLASRGVMIRSLTGRLGTTGWHAELEMVSEYVDLDGLDLVTLLEEPAPLFLPASLALSYVHIEPRPEHEGSLLLTTEGDDCVGFLAAILHTLAVHSLFPVELRARTISRTAVDRIWTKGLGHRTPSEDAARRLARALDALRQPVG